MFANMEKLISDLELDLGDDGNELNELGASFPPLESPPVHFTTDNNTLVTSQTGSTALVPCVINNIGDGMVSWIRRKDYHLLTVGLTTYSSDDRFQAIHLQHSEVRAIEIFMGIQEAKFCVYSSLLFEDGEYQIILILSLGIYNDV
ncbi:hypothetical protein JTB14_019699 [Gonioctena quinquepunctata]|nr:hypothetical protein JTB14_019699 [Gonioctena quinquepunctata]